MGLFGWGELSQERGGHCAVCGGLPRRRHGDQHTSRQPGFGKNEANMPHPKMPHPKMPHPKKRDQTFGSSFWAILISSSSLQIYFLAPATTSRRALLPSQGRALNLIHPNTVLPDGSALGCQVLWQELLRAKRLGIQSDKTIPNSSSHVFTHQGTSGINSLSQRSPLHFSTQIRLSHCILPGNLVYGEQNAMLELFLYPTRTLHTKLWPLRRPCATS